MTKKLTIILVLGLLLTAGNLFSVPNPQGKGKPGMMKHGRFGIHMAENNLFHARMLLRMKDRIGLTDDQVKKIEKMHDRYMEANIKIKADLQIKELKFKSYLKEDNINRKKMEKMIRDIAQVKTDMQVDHMNYLLDLKTLLTNEQLQKIEEEKKLRRHKMMKERFKRREPRRDRRN
jgi:Spy/CpxP family protein refolding chaperone